MSVYTLLNDFLLDRAQDQTDLNLLTEKFSVDTRRLDLCCLAESQWQGARRVPKFALFALEGPLAMVIVKSTGGILTYELKESVVANYILKMGETYCNGKENFFFGRATSSPVAVPFAANTIRYTFKIDGVEIPRTLVDKAKLFLKDTYFEGAFFIAPASHWHMKSNRRLCSYALGKVPVWANKLGWPFRDAMMDPEEYAPVKPGPEGIPLGLVVHSGGACYLVEEHLLRF